MIRVSRGTPPGVENGQVGLLAPTARGWQSTATALTASRACFARFVPTRDMTIVSLSFLVTTAAGADDACDVGVYSSAAARLGSAGATTGLLNSTGAKTLAMTASVPVTAGSVYYAAFSSGTQGGTAGQLMFATFVATAGSQIFGTGNGQVEIAITASAHPLPASPTFGGQLSVPMLWPRES